jgi:hypothetical protein
LFALCISPALAWRPLESSSSRDLLQSCTISQCIRCRNERVSSFTPTEVCLTCSGGYTPSLPTRLSCSECADWREREGERGFICFIEWFFVAGAPSGICW